MNIFKRATLALIIVATLLPMVGYSSVKANTADTNDYSFGNPAGCLAVAPTSPEEMIQHVKFLLGDEDITLEERQNFYIWNGYEGQFYNTIGENMVYEFDVNFAMPPLVYMADRMVSIFQAAGFVVYLRQYGGDFRLLAIPMVDGILDTVWGQYVLDYWDGDKLADDEYVVPVRKKLPCQWVVDAGYVSSDALVEMMDLDWAMPNYTEAGQKYLAGTCSDAYDMATTIKTYGGYPATGDASMMCGPLTFALQNDTNSFPYRVGMWYENPKIFVGTNPRWNAHPWSYFPHDTFDMRSETMSMNGYNFERYGELYAGDIVYSFSALYYNKDSQDFDHIFTVTEVNDDGTRKSISNLVKNWPYSDCSIEEIKLYQSGDRYDGFVNFEWDGNGYGTTGWSGFDVFRWKWITYHEEGTEREYIVRAGDTLETVAFDWKIDPALIAEANGLSLDAQLTSDDTIILPAISE